MLINKTKYKRKIPRLCELCLSRKGNLEKRGVVKEEGETLSDIYKKRRPLYEKWADITVCEKGKNFKFENTINEIIKKLK